MGTVYIEGIRNQPEQVAETLQLTPHLFAIFGLCMGYPDRANLATVKPRLPQAVVLHHETYNLAQQEAAIASATMPFKPVGMWQQGLLRKERWIVYRPG